MELSGGAELADGVQRASGCVSSRRGGDAQAPRHPSSPCCFEWRDG